MEKSLIFCGSTNKEELSVVVCKHVLAGEPMADFQAPGEICEEIEPDFEQPGFAFCEACVHDPNRYENTSVVCFPCFSKMPVFN